MTDQPEPFAGFLLTVTYAIDSDTVADNYMAKFHETIPTESRRAMIDSKFSTAAMTEYARGMASLGVLDFGALQEMIAAEANPGMPGPVGIATTIIENTQATPRVISVTSERMTSRGAYASTLASETELDGMTMDLSWVTKQC